jgi:hypothetical protein
VALQSSSHLLHYLFLAHPTLNPSPLLDAPVVALGLPRSLELAAIGATIAVARADLRGLSAASFVALAFGPILARYHLVLVIPAVALGLEGLREHPARRAIFVVLVAIAAWVPVPATWEAGAVVSVPRLWALAAAWVAVLPWGHRAAIGAAVGAVLSVPGWRLPDSGEGRPLEAPGLPLVAADLVCTDDGTLWFSGLPEPRPGLPGTGWVGYRWPRDGSPSPVAGAAGAHVWSPVAVDASHVAWSTGPAPVGASAAMCPGGREVFLSDAGVGVRAYRLRER